MYNFSFVDINVFDHGLLTEDKHFYISFYCILIWIFIFVYFLN